MAITPTIEEQLRTIETVTANAAATSTAATQAIRLELSTSAPTPPQPEPPPAALPVRAALIIPADYQLKAGLSAYQGKCQQTLIRFREWCKAQTGKAFPFTFDTFRSQYTLLELQTGEGGDAGLFRDDYGQGVWETAIWEKVCRGELGWGTEIAGLNVFRWAVWVLGAGGWAGGRHNSQNPLHPRDDWGTALLGHWQLEAQLTKQSDQACSVYYGPAPKIPSDHPCGSDGGAFSHECLHAFNVHCHQGNLMGDGSVLQCSSYPLDSTDTHPDKRRLTPAQVAEFLQYNGRFIA
jgi:hypothetical protein